MGRLGLRLLRARRLPRPRGLTAPPAPVDGLVALVRGSDRFLHRHRVERERVRRIVGRTAATAGCVAPICSIQPRTRNSPPSPSMFSIGECNAYRPSRPPRRPSGCGRGTARAGGRPRSTARPDGREASRRRGGWRGSRPVRRAAPCRTRRARARRARTRPRSAIAAYPSPRWRTWRRRGESSRRRWAPARCCRIRSRSVSTLATRRWSRARRPSWSSPLHGRRRGVRPRGRRARPAPSCPEGAARDSPAPRRRSAMPSSSSPRR